MTTSTRTPTLVYMTPNQIAALTYLAEKGPEHSMNRLGRSLDIRHTKGNYRGQKKTFGIGGATHTVVRSLIAQGFVKSILTDDDGGDLTTGYEITASGRQKLSEVSDTV